MAATVLTPDAAKNAKIDLVENGKYTQVVHDVVVASRAARRSGTASVKTKATVNLSGRKPWRPKGTGRARPGYASARVWVAGGAEYGPQPRHDSKSVPNQVSRPAVRKAPSARTLAGHELELDSFVVDA